MNGIDPYAYMQQVAVTLGELTVRDEIETVFDELAYRFEIIPPGMQDNAENLISLVRNKLANTA